MIKLKNKTWLNTILVILLTIGCNQPTAIPIAQSNQLQNQITVDLGSQFQLKVKQVGVVEAESFKIKFLNVEDDSRCPADIQCFWSGQIAIVVNIVKNERDIGNFKLISRVGNENLASRVFDGYSIRIIEVSPYPKTTQK